MTDFKVGDRVRVTQTLRGVGVAAGDLATVTEIVDGDGGYIRLDDPRGRKVIQGRSGGAHVLFSQYTNWLELVEETMVPMSRVREVATRYAQANGWCGEVDRALAEIETPKDDELVEVTYTATRKVTLKRKDLGKLLSPGEMKTRYSGVAGQMFASQLAPRDAKIEYNVWSRTEPVEVKPETQSADGWVDCGAERPAVGTLVRVRPGHSTTSLYGTEVSSGREGEVYEPNTRYLPSENGYVLVDFGTRYYIRLEDLQVHAG